MSKFLVKMLICVQRTSKSSYSIMEDDFTFWELSKVERGIRKLALICLTLDVFLKDFLWRTTDSENEEMLGLRFFSIYSRECFEKLGFGKETKLFSEMLCASKKCIKPSSSKSVNVLCLGSIFLAEFLCFFEAGELVSKGLSFEELSPFCWCKVFELMRVFCAKRSSFGKAAVTTTFFF